MPGDNGNAKTNAHQKNLTGFIQLEFTAEPWHLQMNGEFPNFDVALSMLDQARRAVEAKQRLALALEAQQKMAEQAENARIAAALARRS